MKKSITTIISLALLVSCGPSAEEMAKYEKELLKEEKATESTETSESNWEYETKTDEMEGTKQYFATAVSEDEIEIQMAGESSPMNLIVRNSGKGNEVLVTVSEYTGFLPSYEMNEETIKVKFDDEKPVNFAYSMSADGSPDVIFINDAKTFVSKLKASKKIKIEATYIDNGTQISNFEVADLKWDK
jgi:hypothetical protein